MKSNDYKTVLASPDHFCFDECNFLIDELKKGISILEILKTIESMTYVVRKEEKNLSLKSFFDFIIEEYAPGNIEWNKGKVIYKKMYEVLFYH